MDVQQESGNSRPMLHEINVTPFVDVMLVLLIIFMVTAPILQQGLEVELPETAGAGLAVPEDPFILVIKKNREIFIGSARIPLSEVGKKTSAVLKSRKDKQVYIQADKAVEYEVVARALADLRSAGLYQVSLITAFKTK